MKLIKIISGAQTGVDQAGLRVAARLGINTGGWMPRGFRTEEGSAEELARTFGLREHPSHAYPPRTELNVAESDATVIMGFPASPGGLLTQRFCDKMRRPRLLTTFGDDPAELRDWLKAHRIWILNVAGNRESTHPGIGAWAEGFLFDALS